MKIHVGISATFLCFALAGCTVIQTKTLATDRSEVLYGKTLVVDEYPTPTFTASTPGKAIFAMIGAALMIAEGNQFVKESEIHDPAAYIGNQLARRLATQHTITLRPNDAGPLNGNSIDEIAARYPQSDLVLDSQTTYWSYVYFPAHWDSYRLMYAVRTRLIDVRSRSVLAEAFCKHIPEYSDDAPSHERLTANAGEWVKQRLMIYADACVDELANAMFGAATVAEQTASDHATAEPIPALR
ncbi:hypothetical protein BTH42_14840 [Burkholderia sp. SRS-W-2-2016]|uniref:hypothetical protein n=1 Tax=Burkholderia sp. SRS-W-2-2016 TaxID=1926878 RepID=UPI00094A9EE6|nr:hypothetical protein [Burkholderia sp. SRS-W-2-2016]OLL30850.1 hypothetical protein BTH42_14840 [Burkholderia sp. SRS-W-2-2016]